MGSPGWRLNPCSQSWRACVGPAGIKGRRGTTNDLLGGGLVHGRHIIRVIASQRVVPMPSFRGANPESGQLSARDSGFALSRVPE